jgi:hypothetical protein
MIRLCDALCIAWCRLCGQSLPVRDIYQLQKVHEDSIPAASYEETGHQRRPISPSLGSIRHSEQSYWLQRYLNPHGALGWNPRLTAAVQSKSLGVKVIFQITMAYKGSVSPSNVERNLRTNSIDIALLLWSFQIIIDPLIQAASAYSLVRPRFISFSLA